jgi:hypothetical protein
MTEQVFGDMSEEFDFDEETMDYIDGPLSGWLRRKRDNAWFAFDCQPVIEGKLWHWTLVPVPDKSADVARVLAEAAKMKSGSWVSIIEDRRSERPGTCRLVIIENTAAAPVLGSVLARGRDG